MRTLLLALVFVAGCATLTGQGLKYEHCGNIDTLDVYVKEMSPISCQDALSTTQEAYDLLWQRSFGPLNSSWRVEYMWGNIDIDGPLAQTDHEKYLIKVQSNAPRSIFHELGHAYMFEHSTSGSHHKKMCTDDAWRHLENDFGVKPYCHLVRFE